jgi:CBS domain-containing protein
MTAMTRVHDIMRRDVSAVRADAPIKTAVRLMRGKGLPGLPVVGPSGQLIGVLTEGDLPRPSPRRALGWWRAFFRASERVGDVMTPIPVSIMPGASLETVAAVMGAYGLGAVPVRVNDKLVGLVSRADVNKDLAEPPETRSPMASDVRMVREMRWRMGHEPWLSSHDVVIQAHGGIMSLHGLVNSQAERSALVTLARAVARDIRVEDHLLLRTEVLRQHAA